MDLFENTSQAINLTRETRTLHPFFQSAIYGAIGMISCITNVLIIITILSSILTRAKTNMLLVNLAISNLLISIFCIPITIANLLSQNTVTTYGTLCKIHAFVVVTLFVASNYNLILIAVYRYLLIVKTKLHDGIFSKISINIIIVFTWFTVCVICFPPFVGWGAFSYNYRRAHCMVKWEASMSYLLSLQFFSFTLPLVTLAYCYYQILRHTRQSKKRIIHSLSQKQLRKCDCFENRLTITLLFVVACFFLCFSPYAFLIYYEGFFHGIASEAYNFFAMAFAYCNGITDFFIYYTMNSKFRRAFKDLVKSFRKRN